MGLALKKQSQKKLQEIMDTFLWKRSVHCLQTPQRCEANVKKEALCIWCGFNWDITQGISEWPNTAGFLGANPKRIMLFPKQKLLFKRSKSQHVLRRLAVLLAVKLTMKTG
jgi:hypothetical protein